MEPTPHIESLASLPGISQIGVVVHDIGHATRVYSRLLGVSRWYRSNMLHHELTYRGQPAEIEWDIVLGYSRGMQIELIRVLSGERNLYRELLGDGEGFHHIGVIVGNLSARLATAREAGIDVLQHGTIHFAGGAVAHFAYLNTIPHIGFVVELVEARLRGINFGMPEWLLRVGQLTGSTERLG